MSLTSFLFRLSPLLIIFVVEISLPAQFSTGNRFVADESSGRVNVSCQDRGRYDFATFNCYQSSLIPANRAKFELFGVDADKVQLRATYEDGKQRTKSSAFDSGAGQSTKDINLWVETLFQRALLNYGENKISYVLTKSGEEVKRGEFTATVDVEHRECPSRTLASTNIDDCRFSTQVCREYFYRYDCR